MLSFCEQPGICSFVVYITNKCNLRCLKCFNRNLSPFDTEQIEKKLYLAKRFGVKLVVVSGGEPLTLGIDGIVEVLRTIKEKFGGDIRLDTNGTFPDFIRFLLKERLIDGVALDVKIPVFKFLGGKRKIVKEDSRYGMILFEDSSVSVEKIVRYSELVNETLEILKHSNLKYKLCRTVKYPVLTEEEVKSIGVWVSQKYVMPWIELPFVGGSV